MWGRECPYQLADGHNYLDSIAFIRDRLDAVTPNYRDWLLHKTAEKVYFA